VILRLFHRVASHGRAYDWIQNAVGAKRVYAEFAAGIPGHQFNPVVLDISGGTGTPRRHLGVDCRYVCLDLGPSKLRTFRQKLPQGVTLPAGAVRPAAQEISGTLNGISAYVTSYFRRLECRNSFGCPC